MQRLSFRQDQQVIYFLKRHCFHSFCIKKWFENKTVCPLCRIDLRTPNSINLDNDQILNNNNNNPENYNILIEGDQINGINNQDNNNANNGLDNNDNSNQGVNIVRNPNQQT